VILQLKAESIGIFIPMSFYGRKKKRSYKRVVNSATAVGFVINSSGGTLNRVRVIPKYEWSTPHWASIRNNNGDFIANHRNHDGTS